MTRSEAIEVAIEAIRARKGRVESMDRYYSRTERRHEQYLLRLARLDAAIATLEELRVEKGPGLVR